MEAASGERLAELRADGGAAANAWLMQFQADVLGRPVVVPGDRRDDRARRRLPGRRWAPVAWTLDQVASMWREAARYEPRMGEDERESLLERLAESGRAVEGLGRLTRRDRSCNSDFRGGSKRHR